MKFAAAAAVLIARALPADSSSLPSTLEDVVSAFKKKEDVHRHPLAASWPRKNLGGGRLAERTKLKPWAWPQAVASPLLQGRLVAAELGDVGKECDPSSADVLGVLTCGPGLYCVESSRLVAGGMGADNIPAAATSSLGGFCVEDATASTNPDVMHRELQDSYDPTSTLGFVSYICYNRTIDSENNPRRVSCECSGFDVEAYTGFANCSVTRSFEEGYCDLSRKTWCGDNITTICGSKTFNYNFTGPFGMEYTLCFNNSIPEGVASCVTYTYPGPMWETDPTTCLVKVDGIECNSCFIEENNTYYSGIGATTWCVVYDCSNTAIASKGMSCTRVFASFIGASMAAEEMPCEGGCSLCGESGGYISGGAKSSATLPGYGEYSCRYLAIYAASSNYAPFNTLICSNDTLHSELAEQCGCAVRDGGNSPSTTDPPVMPPTEEDDGSSGASGTACAIMTTGLHGLVITATAFAAAGL